MTAPHQRAEDDSDLDALVEGRLDPGAMVTAAKALASSARAAGAKAVASGQWLATTLFEVAPRIKVPAPCRSFEHYDGLEGARRWPVS